jgi:transcriptional regulator with XRE-family HTH domain
MIKVSSEQLERPEFRRAVATGDWATVLHAVVQETGASQTEIAIAVGVSQPHVSRLMNGRSREPGIRTVRALCNGLGIPLSLAGLLDDAQGEATNRRQFISGAAGAAGLAMIGTVDGEIPVDSADDERLLAIPSSTYRRLEQRMPSRLLLPPVASHLSLIRQVAAKDGHNAAHQRRLFSLLSETAGLAAWLYMDVDDRAAARRHYQLAVRAAERSGHPLLPAYMQASMGQFAATCGDAVDGLRLVAAARQRLARSAPPIATVWLDCIEALAMAEARNRHAMTRLDQAEARIGRATADEPVWPWIFRFDNRKLAGFRAQAATALGQNQIAKAALRDAYDARQAPKPRAAMEVLRARSLANSGRIEEACNVALAACDIGLAYDSERVLRAVARFRNDLGTRAGGGIVAELDERLFSLYKEDV